MEPVYTDFSNRYCFETFQSSSTSSSDSFYISHFLYHHSLSVVFPFTKKRLISFFFISSSGNCFHSYLWEGDGRERRDSEMGEWNEETARREEMWEGVGSRREEMREMNGKRREEGEERECSSGEERF